MSPHATADHFNNWPNDIGFDADFEQKDPVELPVTGQIPPYVAGVLYRTGPGKRTVETERGDTFKVDHWFDGFSQTHRFQLVATENAGSPMRVYYNSRFSTDKLIEEVRKTGSGERLVFGQKQDPCKEAYKKVQSEYVPAPSEVNVGVTLSVNMPGLGALDGSSVADGRWNTSSGIKNLYAKTDYNIFKQLDPDTMEPIGLASQGNFHPDLKGPLSASHARSDPKTGDVFNFNLGFEPHPTYRIFRVSASTGKTDILATFSAVPAYLHSLLISEDYVILCVWNSHLSPAKLQTGTFVDAMLPFDPSQPAKWYVVDRKTDKGLVATYDSAPFFCFHTISAWQEPSPDDPSKIDILAELATFENTEFVKSVYYERLLSSSPKAKEYRQLRSEQTKSSLTRFRLPNVPTTPTEGAQPATVEWSEGRELSPELPTLNPKYTTQKHRYTYGIIDTNESTFFNGIMKFDSETKAFQTWKVQGHSPGEPIFVADPNGINEDDGVLLSVVLNGPSGKSYLLCLDARNLNELGRADVDGPVAFGFHGQHVPLRSGAPTGDY
ncbi:putative dioxygenase [Aspergillus taichungensis]|uniref:Putative dioxygenase n=1 Tax=Aspergillus taichungensis TaxID=482145 RepID=A0A2J5I018_9EURO|nr:putative dioxygenase [Aspergillus taichungensis]